MVAVLQELQVLLFIVWIAQKYGRAADCICVLTAAVHSRNTLFFPRCFGVVYGSSAVHERLR